MAALSFAELLKRNNIEILLNRVLSGDLIEGTSSSGKRITFKPVIRINDKETSVSEKSKSKIAETMKLVLESSNDKKIELVSVKGVVYSISKFYKDFQFAGKKSEGVPTDKAHAERQERAIIEIITSECLKGNKKIYGIPDTKFSRAEKMEGLSSLNQEPYIDVKLFTDKNKMIGISCKGEAAPSLAGGGLKGLKTIKPKLMERLFKRIEVEFKKMGFVEGKSYPQEKVQDLYFEIPSTDVKDILRGTPAMGGPVEYMYIGSMDVKYVVDKGGIIHFTNGEFKDIDKYSKKKFYFRIRQRDSKGQKLTFDFKTMVDGFPVVHRVGSKKTSRVVIQDKVPAGNKAFKI